MVTFSERGSQMQVPIQEGAPALHWAQWGGDCWQQHDHRDPLQEVREGDAGWAKPGPEERPARYDRHGGKPSPLVSTDHCPLLPVQSRACYNSVYDWDWSNVIQYLINVFIWLSNSRLQVIVNVGCPTLSLKNKYRRIIFLNSNLQRKT